MLPSDFIASQAPLLSLPCSAAQKGSQGFEELLSDEAALISVEGMTGEFKSVEFSTHLHSGPKDASRQGQDDDLEVRGAVLPVLVLSSFEDSFVQCLSSAVNVLYLSEPAHICFFAKQSCSILYSACLCTRN